MSGPHQSSKTPHVGPLLFLLLLFLCASATQQSSPPSVYEILSKYGLPQGLLPNAITSYTLSDDGGFSVVLGKPCYVEFDYLVYYDQHITGKLSYGSIADLKGIQVKKLFLWLNVDEIKVDLPPSDSIYFQVGLINKRLDVDQFKTVHSCRDDAAVYSWGCGRGGFWDRVLQLPTPADDVPMLITE